MCLSLYITQDRLYGLNKLDSKNQPDVAVPNKKAPSADPEGVSEAQMARRVGRPDTAMKQ